MALPDEPYTRVERYLARLAGQNVDIPEYPITRIECYLDYLCGNGGGVPASNAGAHNAVFRGKDLGTSFTDAQSVAIAAGTFDDLFVGDYWTINSTVYRIAGADLFYNFGDTNLLTHHLVIVPDQRMYTYAMNNTDTTEGGYAGSLMKSEGLSQALETIQNDFGSSHILSHRALLTNGGSASGPTGWAWTDSMVDLMSESQVMGRGGFGTISQSGYNVGASFIQFPMFHLRPELIVTRTTYWLSDVRNASAFSIVQSTGSCSYGSASSRPGVRPYFLIA